MKNIGKPTTAIILEIRKPRKDDTFPVKLRVTYSRKQKYYNLQDERSSFIYMTKETFTKVMGERPRDSYKDLRIHLNELDRIAVEDVIEKLPVFSFEAFEEKYFNKQTSSRDAIALLEQREKDLVTEGRISTAITMKNTYRSLKAYLGRKVLPFESVTVSFLKKYENWMLKKGNSLTTVGIYLRNLRTIYNYAQREGLIKDVPYPFGKDRYQIPTGKNIKKALSQQEVGMIANYKVIDGSHEHRYRDYWLFAYLCNGINVKDMARIRYADIEGDQIHITRAKTERERRNNPKPITIVITKRLGQIIDRWSNQSTKPDEYVLPILEKGMTAKQEFHRVQDITKLINSHIGTISEDIGITLKVTTYTARHSFATVLKRSGASMEFISESLGHSNLQTTENYLADFEIEEKRKWAEKAADF